MTISGLNQKLVHQPDTKGKVPLNVNGAYGLHKSNSGLHVGGKPETNVPAGAKAKGKLKHFSKIAIKGAIKNGIKTGGV